MAVPIAVPMAVPMAVEYSLLLCYVQQMSATDFEPQFAGGCHRLHLVADGLGSMILLGGMRSLWQQAIWACA